MSDVQQTDRPIDWAGFRAAIGGVAVIDDAKWSRPDPVTISGTAPF